MKRFIKSLVLVAIFVGMAMPSWSQASTEGSDFWVTFLQADQDNNNNLILELTITSRDTCAVTIENPYTSYKQTLQVSAGKSTTVKLYEGDVRATQARNAMTSSGKVCYAVNSEQVDNCALHVTAKDTLGNPAKISLFASNYKKATFDATNVIPTASLLDEYIVQTYTPSDHGGTSATQGSHFAIIAAEDNVVVDYWPTVATTGHAANTKVTTPPLSKGQVWYVWTGKKDSIAGDLSGTRVVAQDGKKIAVFQGCPHTNIPYQVKQRDHLFSQAMPTAYWGNRFVLTASKERKKDVIRILALYDHTQVLINDQLVHTFDFQHGDSKQYWEFVIGENGDYAENGSCYLTTSCPCAVHLFMASQNFDGVANGDPAMLWVNPIEQRIDQITFATYNSKNGNTQHYTNIVTDKPQLMTLDGNSIASAFKKVDGNSNYSYAQLSLGSTATSHTLKSNGSSFIAHVYGFTDNESYGYSAGSATIGREIAVNEVSFESGERAKTIADAPTFCQGDTVHYDLRDVSGSIYRIVLDFGDGTTKDTSKVSIGAMDDDNEPFLVSIKHAYPTPGWYDASAIVYGKEFCSQPAFTDTIPIIFRVLRPDTIRHQKYVCLGVDEEEPTNEQKIEKYDCDSVVITTFEYGHKSTYVYYDTVYNGCWINGREYKDLDDYVIPWTIKNSNKDRCDSNVICHLHVYHCLDLEIPNHPDEQHICPGDKFELKYNRSKGEIGEAHLIYGTEDIIVELKNGFIELPTSEMKPGIYHATITVEDKICKDETTDKQRILSFPVDFSVYYPSSIFKFKFNNVLAVYNKDYNGGYDFVEPYQWYYNGQPIEGATTSVYHSDVPLQAGEYYVVLTNTNGMTLPSCSQYIEEEDIPDYNELQQEAAAAKLLMNRQIVIRKGADIYNIYGQRVQ